MENRPLRFGILGTGDGARNHARGFRSVPPEIAVLASVCGRDLARIRAFADGAGGIEGVYWDQAAFLADPDLDAVIVATPDALHADHAIAALEADKHVLVEKPMGLSLEDAERVYAALMGVPNGLAENERSAFCKRRRSRKIGVGYHLRHHAGHRWLREELRRGVIGTPHHAHLEWATLSMGPDGWRARSDQGWWALAALGTHAMDLMHWLFAGDMAYVRRVRARRGASDHGTRDERVTIDMEFENGFTASAYVSVSDKPVKYFRILGSTGVIECRDTLVGGGTGEIVLPDGARLAFDPVNPYAAQIIDFAAAVRDDRQPEANLRAGMTNLAFLDAADRFMKSRG